MPSRTASQRVLAEPSGDLQATRSSALHLPSATARPFAQTSVGTAAWQPLGPINVSSQNFGAVTGRVTSIALDPADTTGNRVYLGTTGGGVWLS